jgi:hypothetical protein
MQIPQAKRLRTPQAKEINQDKIANWENRNWKLISAFRFRHFCFLF